MTKAELRRLFLTKRKALSTNDVHSRSQEIAQAFFDFLAQLEANRPLSLIHVFLPIERQNEVDTWQLIRPLWNKYPDSQLAVSVTDIATNQLRHYPLHPTTPLVKNRWGIPEPVDLDQPTIESSQLDMVLIPLLVFDKQGNRVGYGKGFYDRFLADCRPDCLKLGLSLVEPVEQIDGVEITDIRLNACISPERLYLFD